jgi:hypothetical protein
MDNHQKARQAARDASLHNEAVLMTAPPGRPPSNAGDSKWADYVPGFVLSGIDKGMDVAGEQILKNAPKIAGPAVALGKGALSAPSLIYDLVGLGAAKDKSDYAKKLASAEVGAAVGGFIGELGGPPGIIAGAAIGNAAGEYLYDHRQALFDDATRGLAGGQGPHATDPIVGMSLVGGGLP